MSIQNNLVIGGQVTLVSGGLRTVMSLSSNLTTTGSNFISNNANINTGSWQSVDEASNTGYRYGFYVNTDATSSIKLAIGSSSTSSYSAFLLPGDCAIIPNSGGATPIFANATGSNPTVILQYMLIEP